MTHSFHKGAREIIIKDTIIFHKALLQLHARLSGAFRECGVTAKPRELASSCDSGWAALFNSTC